MPRSLFDPATRASAPATVFSQADCEALTKKVLSFATAPTVNVVVSSTITGSSKFAHSQITTGRDAFETSTLFQCTFDERSADMWTTRTDDDGLRAAVTQAEAIARQGPKRNRVHLVQPGASYANPRLWYDQTNALGLEARTDVAHTVAGQIAAAGLVGAGTIIVSTGARAVANNAGLFTYGRSTNARLSASARAKDNTGSGWASGEAFDWTTLNGAAIAARAIDKCKRSLNPVAVEPGRYTTVIEPAAYAEMIWLMMMNQMELDRAEQGATAFGKKGGGSKIGLRVLDPRLSLVSDPMDPDGPFLPFDWRSGRSLDRTVWIDHGVLKTLAVTADYAEEKHLPRVIDNPLSCRLMAEGTPTSIDEMIASTKRGVYVSRMGGITQTHLRTMVYTGVTCDGTWLIEDGKITKPIKNFRFIESPLFFLNNLEQVGKPELVPVWPETEFVLPAIKVRDFNFISLADAI
jgi:predicted Zn-dependent protease